MTTNEAAERLRETALDWERRLLDEALAAERRATVERIRERYEVEEFYGWVDDKVRGGAVSELKLLAILDEEAAR